MKHVFIINPAAGVKDISEPLIQKIKELLPETDVEIHTTTGKNDARDFTNDYLQEHLNEEVRLYSCGGDGTLNEVLNGMVGYKNASLACYPSGSGNDFVKNFEDPKRFLDLAKLIQGTTKEIDIIQFNGRYAINICNLGFDGEVGYNFQRFKKIPKIKGPTAYNLAVFWGLLSKMKHMVKIEVDGAIFYEGYILLSAIANGLCYGGGYYCAPRANVDDGVLDVVVVKRVSRFTFVKLIKIYKRGDHLEHPKLQKYIRFTNAKEVKITSKKPISLSFDGEIVQTSEMNFRILPKNIRFVVPN